MNRNSLSFLLGLFIILITVSCEGKQADNRGDMEEAYFEGQKDALAGDVRIKKSEDGCWEWVVSPWDKDPDLDHLEFDPSKDCDD